MIAQSTTIAGRCYVAYWPGVASCATISNTRVAAGTSPAWHETVLLNFTYVSQNDKSPFYESFA